MPTENAVTIRQPATANLMLDSLDRNINNDPSCWNYQITKTNSIMNGFFTRVATTEVVLEWCYENIQAAEKNNTIVVNITGLSGNVTNQTITLLSGFYTVAQCLDTIARKMTDLSGTTGSAFTVVQLNGQTGIQISSGTWNLASETILSGDLGLFPDTAAKTNYIGDCPDLRAVRYLDFVSSQLTYNQDLKDNSTQFINRDVLCRWYMAWDEAPVLDKYGFPIYMGYTEFRARRLFNPPKQIRWSNNQPLGNIAFSVYAPDGTLMPVYDTVSNWLMTLQFSEN